VSEEITSYPTYDMLVADAEVESLLCGVKSPFDGDYAQTSSNVNGKYQFTHASDNSVIQYDIDRQKWKVTGGANSLIANSMGPDGSLLPSAKTRYRYNGGMTYEVLAKCLPSTETDPYCAKNPEDVIHVLDTFFNNGPYDLIEEKLFTEDRVVRIVTSDNQVVILPKGSIETTFRQLRDQNGAFTFDEIVIATGVINVVGTFTSSGVSGEYKSTLVQVDGCWRYKTDDICPGGCPKPAVITPAPTVSQPTCPKKFEQCIVGEVFSPCCDGLHCKSNNRCGDCHPEQAVCFSHHDCCPGMGCHQGDQLVKICTKCEDCNTSLNPQCFKNMDPVTRDVQQC